MMPSTHLNDHALILLLIVFTSLILKSYLDMLYNKALQK